MPQILDTDDLALRIGGRGAIRHKSYWMVCCPAHDDKTPSLKISSGRSTVLFNCYAGCEAIDIIKEIYNKFDALPWNANSTNTPSTPRSQKPQSLKPPVPELEWGGPVMDGAPTPGQTPYPTGASETARWPWRDAQGRIVFWNIRADHPEGRKTFIPMSMWKGLDGIPRWTHAAPPSHPLYNLHRNDTTLPIIFSEGEKTADTARRIFGSTYWSTTAGSSNGLPRCDLTPLAGRKLIISPDLDSPGIAHAHAVANRAQASKLLVLIPPDAIIALLSPGDDLTDLAKIMPPDEISAEIHNNPDAWLHSLSP